MHSRDDNHCALGPLEASAQMATSPRKEDGNKKQQVAIDHIGDCGADRQTDRKTD